MKYPKSIDEDKLKNKHWGQLYEKVYSGKENNSIDAAWQEYYHALCLQSLNKAVDSNPIELLLEVAYSTEDGVDKLISYIHERARVALLSKNFTHNDSQITEFRSFIDKLFASCAKDERYHDLTDKIIEKLVIESSVRELYSTCSASDRIKLDNKPPRESDIEIPLIILHSCYTQCISKGMQNLYWKLCFVYPDDSVQYLHLTVACLFSSLLI